MTPLRKALLFMFSHRFRRVFLSAGGTFISDRSIISHIFSPAALHDLAANPRQPPGGADSGDREEQTQEGPWAHHAQGGREHSLSGDIGQCLTSRGTVITPWDIIMKPWVARSSG